MSGAIFLLAYGTPFHICKVIAWFSLVDRERKQHFYLLHFTGLQNKTSRLKTKPLARRYEFWLVMMIFNTCFVFARFRSGIDYWKIWEFINSSPAERFVELDFPHPNSHTNPCKGNARNNTYQQPHEKKGSHNKDSQVR